MYKKMLQYISSKIAFGRSNQRTRLDWLKSELHKLPSKSSILDAGAGELRNKEFCRHLKYTSQDICQYDGVGDSAGLHTGEWDTGNIDIISDIDNIPVTDSSFDAVVCTEVLEHVYNPIEVVDELLRVLKPGGTLILTVPFCSLTHFAPHYYYSGYSRYWLEKSFRKHNLELLSIHNNGGWFDFIAQELWRIPMVGKKYALFPLSVIALLLGLPLLICLKVLALYDRDSQSLLTYGYHVKAIKK